MISRQSPQPYQGCALPLSYDGDRPEMPGFGGGAQAQTLQIGAEHVANLPIELGDPWETCSRNVQRQEAL